MNSTHDSHLHRQVVQEEESWRTKEMSVEALPTTGNGTYPNIKQNTFHHHGNTGKMKSEMCPLKVHLDMEGTATHLLLTCVECFPGTDRSLLASALQLMFPVQSALDLNRWQLLQLLKSLQFPETLSATACCEAWCAFRLLQLYFHALCTLDVCTYKQLTLLDATCGDLMLTRSFKQFKSLQRQ